MDCNDVTGGRNKEPQLIKHKIPPTQRHWWKKNVAVVCISQVLTLTKKGKNAIRACVSV